MPILDTGDIGINYRLEGDADLPLLVLSNSLGTDLTMWDGQVKALSSYIRVLRYDTRGHGASSVPNGSYTIDQLGADLIALMNGLDISITNFCGVSMGGVIGQWLGIRAPERLDKLILSNTAASIGTVARWNDRIQQVQRSGLESVRSAVLDIWFTHSFQDASPDTVQSFSDMFLSTPSEGYNACCAAVRDFDFRKQVAQIKLPTLVIAGTRDVATTAEDARFLTEHIDNAQLVEVQAAHLSNVEAADDFSIAVRDFILP